MIVILLGVEQSIDMQKEDNEKERGRGWQTMHGENMIQDQRAKAMVT